MTRPLIIWWEIYGSTSPSQNGNLLKQLSRNQVGTKSEPSSEQVEKKPYKKGSKPEKKSKKNEKDS